MLSIGEFSKACRVSTKTLRHYAKLGIIKPRVVNEETGYRYYAMEQLEAMLFIQRLKSYRFSLEEIKTILEVSNSTCLWSMLALKQTQLQEEKMHITHTLTQPEDDMKRLKERKSFMSYMDDIPVQLVEVDPINVLYVRKVIKGDGFEQAYRTFFQQLVQTIDMKGYHVIAPAMVLFYSAEYGVDGLESEFAILIQEENMDTRMFYPGLCLKSVVYGGYEQLSSVYEKQIFGRTNTAMKEMTHCLKCMLKIAL